MKGGVENLRLDVIDERDRDKEMDGVDERVRRGGIGKGKEKGNGNTKREKRETK